MTKKKRFLPLKEHKGIRKDTITGKYYVRKYINGVEYSETFKGLIQAINWRNSFHPLLTNTEVKFRNSTTSANFPNTSIVTARPNGVDNRFTFRQVWELYCEQHLPSLERQSVNDTTKRAQNLFPDMFNYKMTEITAELIDVLIKKKVEQAKIVNNPRRYSFRGELKTLKAFLNWYRENYDTMFVVPVLKRHFISSIVRPKQKEKKKKMTPEQVKMFLGAFDKQFWRDLAEFHFYMAGRVQEPAGLQWESVDFKNGLVRVSDVAVWGNDKQFSYLKETPKNGEDRIVYLNSSMMEILKRRMNDKPVKECEFFRESTGEPLNFVFHQDGRPLNYRQIQYNYNKALKRANLFPEFRATHILRKAMANIVRQAMGLDAAQAMGGWKSREVVEKIYTDAPNEINREAVNVVEEIMQKNKVVNCENSSKKFVKKPKLVLVKDN